MKFQKLLVNAAAACLLLGASNAMARVVDAWLVVGVESASGNVAVESDVCMGAVVELRDMGFQFRFVTHLETRLAALFFLKSGDAATLFCLANIIEEQSGLFGD